jgi:nicotinamide-nucleotide amidase
MDDIVVADGDPNPIGPLVTMLPSADRRAVVPRHDGGGERMRIEILCTGDEVLTGKITNTNFSYMSQKLEDAGLSVFWGTTVGDDRASLLAAFRLAGERADAVIVNGGLGPTVDDLSQEIAAQAARVDLELNEDWLKRMEEFFARRSRVMPDNNRKQAMLPVGAEVLDNPVGTACGFAMDIGKARFFFTPGVPRELRRMLEGEIVPRLLARSGEPTVIHLKRFHSYGLGESHVDALLAGIEAMDPDGDVKLGFRAHYPQLETKLTVRGKDRADVDRKLAPVEAEVRKRVGNFILAEDDKTLEGVILAALAERNGSLAVVETFTGGQIAARIAPLPGAETIFRRGIVARTRADILAAVGLANLATEGEYDLDVAAAVAGAALNASGATHALAVLVDLDEGADRIDLGGSLSIAIATAQGVERRRARIVGGRDWVRLGAVEMGLDCLRRYLSGLPVYERIDFEKV